jgi:tyrosyl-tRNA synthetase
MCTAGRNGVRDGAMRNGLLDGEKLADPNREFAGAAELEGKVVQVGKKVFRRLVG